MIHDIVHMRDRNMLVWLQGPPHGSDALFSVVARRIDFSAQTQKYATLEASFCLTLHTQAHRHACARAAGQHPPP